MIWYPYTQMKNMKTPYEIIGGEGVYIHTREKKLIDSISSWWSVIHGYNNKEINEALKNQVDKFSHVMLGGLTHDPVKKLAKKLKEIMPEDLDNCFFCGSGSIAVEVALKMSIQYYYNKDKPDKNMIVALKNSYHGDSFKTMEIGDDEDYHHAFPNKASVFHIDIDPHELEIVLRDNSHRISCLIVEPLLQGAGGMRMYGIDFLEKARELCDKHDVLLIFDEVATGFGRTGYDFVSNVVIPDIVVLGKALTAGYMGHAVTIGSRKVFEGFYSDDPLKAFMHGPTFMANPLACTVALKSIEIFYRDNYLQRIRNIEEKTRDYFKDFESNKIKEIRIMGGCLCIEVFDKRDIEGFSDYAYESGVFNRPFSKYIYAMLPYIIEDKELYHVLGTFKSWFLR